MRTNPKSSFPAKRLLLATALLVGSCISSVLAEEARFSFGAGAVAKDRTVVTSALRYSEGKGYGFENDDAPQFTEADGKGYCTSEKPFLFSVKLPEGNYRVTVLLGNPKGESETTIKAENRRLMVRSFHTEKGVLKACSFIVNTRTTRLAPPPLNAPGGSAVITNDREQGSLTWDDKLTLEFDGPRASLVALDIEPVQVPTLFLAGDSTVTDQPGEPAASWGQMLPYFFEPTVAVANHAESGETLKSFVTAHRFDKILEQIKPGDYLFVQFGHNDSKTQWPQTYAEPGTTYDAYLRVFIAEARRRGAFPILVTSMHRRRFSADGKIVDTHGEYPKAVRRIAAEQGVPLVDLHALSAVLFEALGPERSAKAFTDATHHTNYGAFELARCVAEALRQNVPALASRLKKDLPGFDPANPDDPDSWSLPASPARMTRPPRGN